MNTQLQLEATQTTKTMSAWNIFAADFKKTAKDTGNESQSLGNMMANTAKQMDTAFATAIVGALESGKSVGAALEAATKQILQQLATQALSKALYYTAEGIAAATMGNPQAAGYFAAAAEFGLVAGASLGVSMAMGGSGSGSGQSATPNPGQTTTSSAGGGGTNQTGGVTKLAAGGVVSKPTTFIAGDSPSGGEADEAILPLSDPSAMRQVANAIAPGGLPQSTPGEESAFDPESIKRMTEAISALTGTRDASQDFRFAEPATGEKAGFQFDGSTSPRSSDNRTVGEALGFYSGAYGERSPTDKPRFNSAEGTPSEKLNDDFGTPSAGDRPAFDFNQTPLPREMPDVQALAAQFGGGLLSASTLRAASDSQSATAAAAPPAVFDQASMEKFAARLDAQRDPSGGSNSGGGEVHHHTHVAVKGLMDSGNLKKIIKKQNLLVKNRQATVKASDSLRISRRSQ